MQIFGVHFNFVLFTFLWLLAQSNGIPFKANQDETITTTKGINNTLALSKPDHAIIDGYALVNYTKSKLDSHPGRLLRSEQLQPTSKLFNLEQNMAENFFKTPSHPWMTTAEKNILEELSRNVVIFPAVTPPNFIKEKAIIPRGNASFPYRLMTHSSNNEISETSSKDIFGLKSKFDTNTSNIVTLGGHRTDLSKFLIKRNRIGGIILIPKKFYTRGNITKAKSNNESTLSTESNDKNHLEPTELLTKSEMLNKASNENLDRPMGKTIKPTNKMLAQAEDKNLLEKATPDSRLHISTSSNLNENHSFRQSGKLEREVSIGGIQQPSILLKKENLSPQRRYLNNIMLRNLHFNVLQNYRLPNHTKSIIAAMLEQREISDQQKLILYSDLEARINRSEDDRNNNSNYRPSSTLKPSKKQNDVLKPIEISALDRLSDKQKLEVLQKIINKQKENFFYRQLIYQRIENITKSQHFPQQSSMLDKLVILYQQYRYQDRILTQQRASILQSLQTISPTAAESSRENALKSPVARALASKLERPSSQAHAPQEIDTSTSKRGKDIVSAITSKSSSGYSEATSESLLNPIFMVASDGLRRIRNRVRTGAVIAGTELSFLAEETTKKLIDGLQKGTSNVVDVALDAYRGARQTQFFLEKLASESVRNWGQLVGTTVKEVLEQTESIVSSFGNFLFSLKSNFVQSFINHGENLKGFIANQAESVNMAVQKTANVLKRISNNTIESFTRYDPKAN